MPKWDMRERVESGFLDDFDAECVKAGFIEGLVAADRSTTGKAVPTQQLLLLWKPLDVEEAAEQPSWYSMGQKGVVLGGARNVVTIGKTPQELHAQVIEGPGLAKNSKMGLLLDRLDGLGWVPDSPDEAKVFLGLKVHLKREDYEQSSSGGRTLSVEKQTLMPVSLISGGDTHGVGTVDDTADMDKTITEAVIGVTEEDIVKQVANLPQIKAIGLSITGLLKVVDRLHEEGFIARDAQGKYQKV